MKPPFRVSRAGLELIKAFEGYRPSAARLAGGGWTVGYGHTKSARAGAEVSLDDAEALLIYDLIEVSAAIDALVFAPLTQNQFDALASFAFNIGLSSFRASAVLRLVNEGAMLQAASALELWRKADFEGERIVVDALVRRRAAEKTLFLTPPNGWVAAPSPVLPPKRDAEPDAANLVEPVVDLTASLEGETAVVSRRTSPALDAAAEPASQITEAAEALTARLEALLRTEAAAPGPATESSPDLDDLPDLEPAAQPIQSEREKTDLPWPTLVDAEPAPAPARTPVAAALDEELDPFPKPIYRQRPIRELFPYASLSAPPSRPVYQAYLLLAFVGLIIFAVATNWAFAAHAKVGGFSPMVIGLPFALIGIACVAWAVYSLISKFGERED
jgi:lysozyme